MDGWMRKCNIIFDRSTYLIDIGTNTRMRQSALMGQDETAVQHEPLCIPTGDGDQTQDFWIGGILSL